MKSIFHVVLLCLGLTGAALAQTPQPVQQNNSNAVWFDNWTGLSNATWTISQPDGEIIQIFAPSGTPVFQLVGGRVIDGAYRYELTAATAEKVAITNKQNNGRGDAARDHGLKSFQMSGVFHVQRGVIVVPELIKEKEEG